MKTIEILNKKELIQVRGGGDDDVLQRVNQLKTDANQ